MANLTSPRTLPPQLPTTMRLLRRYLDQSGPPPADANLLAARALVVEAIARLETLTGPAAEPTPRLDVPNDQPTGEETLGRPSALHALLTKAAEELAQAVGWATHARDVLELAQAHRHVCDAAAATRP
jgi:hypothetical protein